MITAEVIADSVSQHDDRITTFVCTYPRFIHSELMTHRMFSRNASSSRAIPVDRMIAAIEENPAKPDYWGLNRAGMKADEELTEEKKQVVQSLWDEAMVNAISVAKKMKEAGAHKQIVNRILEPFAHITVIITATEWNNFFNLRAHPDAQPEFQKLAYEMLKKYKNSRPSYVPSGEWHIPFADKAWTKDTPLETRVKVATARCARVSYLNFEGEIDIQKDLALHDSLLSSGHFSPFEHCAVPCQGICKNFRGWMSYRSFLVGENKTELDERLR